MDCQDLSILCPKNFLGIIMFGSLLVFAVFFAKYKIMDTNVLSKNATQRPACYKLKRTIWYSNFAVFLD